MRYGRAAVMASKASATWRIRASFGISSPISRSGYPDPLYHSWWCRMIGSSGASFVTGAMICAPSTGCEFMIVRSSLLRRSAFLSTLSGTPILPTSWSRPPHSRASSSASPTRMTRPISTEISFTRTECFEVIRIALVDGLRQGPDGLREHVAHLDEALVSESRRVQRDRKQRRSPPMHGVHKSHKPRQRSESNHSARDTPRVTYQRRRILAAPCAAQAGARPEGNSTT